MQRTHQQASLSSCLDLGQGARPQVGSADLDGFLAVYAVEFRFVSEAATVRVGNDFIGHGGTGGDSVNTLNCCTNRYAEIM